MTPTDYPFVLLLAAVVLGGPTLLTAAAVPRTISGTVSGNVQGVGFRAMILKEAIKYNLAGEAKNDPDKTVRFTLQGDSDRIDQALAAIREGTKKSSNVTVTTIPIQNYNPLLGTFTVWGWTSISRNITTPYDLIYRLRSPDDVIKHHAAKDYFNEILRTTLKGDDLVKFLNHVKNKDKDDDE